MMDLHTYGLFFAAAIILVITPGPDTILILSRTLASGIRPGLWTLIGTQVGNVTHALLAGMGISTIILLIPAAFQVLKLVGAGYLLYLAVKTWRTEHRFPLSPNQMGPASSSRGFFLQGLISNLVNPKVIFFFLALFPQFINLDSGPLALQSLVLGLTLAAIAIVWVGCLVVFVGRARALAARSEPFVRFMRRLAAIAFAGLAVRLALSDR